MNGINILNSPGMWLACCPMMIALLVQASWFLKMALKEAERLGINNVKDGIKAAALTAIGPSICNVLIIITLVATIGAPNTWQRVNDIAAPRTELATAQLLAEYVGESLGGNLSMNTISFMLWGLSFGAIGWMVVTLFLTPNMGKAVNVLNNKFNPLLIKSILATSSFGVFCYMLFTNTVGKLSTSIYYSVAAIIGCAVMFLIKRFCKDRKIIMQLSLGIAILVGVTFTAIIQNIAM